MSSAFLLLSSLFFVLSLASLSFYFLRCLYSAFYRPSLFLPLPPFLSYVFPSFPYSPRPSFPPSFLLDKTYSQSQNCCPDEKLFTYYVFIIFLKLLRETRDAYHVLDHPREPRGQILSLVPHYQKKYPWERSLLELVPEVEIQNGGIQIINVFA